ncbi:MAG: hypothetical protein CBB69_001585 [Phycisphaera sp. TMED9]|nr:MAG: hypothetical protein CBB69_001585 [Phycisphaera sp. TMED9]
MPLTTTTVRSSLFLALSMPIAGSAAADDFVIESKESSYQQAFSISIPFAGTLIGDYDAKTNPEGTQTRPGLFGGSGNNPIDYTANFELVAGAGQFQPSGSVDADLSSLQDGSFTVDAFQIDVLAGGSTTVSVDLVMIYQTFRTFSPFSLYPGGFEIPIPLQEGTITQMVLSSVGPTVIDVIESRDGFTFTGGLPGTLTMEGDFGTGPQPFELPVLLPIAGELIIGGEESRLEMASDLSVSGEQPVDFPPFEQIPLSLPTLPPGDELADLLLDGTVETFASDLELSMLLVAFAETAYSPADFNHDGVVNGADLGLLIGAWGVCEGCPEDINEDGLVNGADLGLLFGDWTA